tara:strand:- start:717 stop:1064 length:348 start_codon:yes stop_codon:yes gene_type:complete
VKRIIIVALMLFPFLASAGPPAGSYPKQVPFILYCHKDESVMLYAVQSSFHEYISATSDIGDEDDMKLFILEDPDDKSMSIIVTNGGETCLVFNGSNTEHFDEPDYIPSEKDENI